jgi:hypothetical protein
MSKMATFPDILVEEDFSYHSVDLFQALTEGAPEWNH